MLEMQRFVLVGRLRIAERQFSMGNYSQFILEANRILENVMKAKLDDQMTRARKGDIASEKAKKLLQEISHVGSLTRIPFSSLIRLFQKAGLFSSPTSDTLPFFTMETVDRIRRIRNKCEHESYKASNEEASWVRSSLDLILREIDAKSIPSLQRKIAISEYEKKKSKELLHMKYLQEKTIDIRLALSDMIDVEFKKLYDEDAPKFYETSATYSVVGAYPAGEKIVIMVVIEPEYIHDDVLDNVIEEIVERVLSSLSTVKGLKPETIEVDVYDSYEELRRASM